MKTMIKHYARYALLTLLSLAISVSMVMGQEEVEAAESSSNSPVWMIGVFALGFLTVAGLGMAMNAQASDEASASV